MAGVNTLPAPAAPLKVSATSLTSSTAPTTPPAAPVMGTYPASAFTSAAAKLPAGMDVAIGRDLHLTPAQYLANAQAASEAAKVLAALKSKAVPVLSSQMVGTTLSVTVPDTTAAAAVEATGAQATVGAPAPAPAIAPSFAAASTSVIGGTGWYYPTETTSTGTSGVECSVGFSGIDKTTGAQQYVTAGHCYTGGSTVTVHAISQSHPADSSASVDMNDALGTAEGSTFQYGNDDDSGLVQINNPLYVGSPLVTTWSGGSGSPSTTTSVTGTSAGVVGGDVCKSGATSGWTCGTILAVDEVVNVTDDGASHDVNTIVTNACVLPGDSGGAALSGTNAIGITSGGNFTSCSSSAESVFYPMVSTGSPQNSILGQHPNWVPTLTVPTATVTSPASGSMAFSNATLSGSILGSANGATVGLYTDGSLTTSQTAASSSNFSFPLSAASAGTHSFVVKVTMNGVTTSSTPVSVQLLKAPQTINRIAGADRYETAVDVAQQTYGPYNQPSVVYVASGMNYPDALAAAPAAAEAHGPLLLTEPSSVPSEVLSELQTLNPPRVVVVGGTASVSDAAMNQIVSALPNANVQRIGGADRFQTGSMIVTSAFPSGASSAYVATGYNFPDALSATAAAGANHEPIILVPGTETTLDATTQQLLATLGTHSITLIGGTSAVTPQLASAISALGISVNRVAGADRFATSAQINSTAFPSASSVYLASGLNFPDALAGSVLAASSSAPLYVTQTTCIPSETALDLSNGNDSTLTLLGGTATLTPSVQALSIC